MGYKSKYLLGDLFQARRMQKSFRQEKRRRRRRRKENVPLKRSHADSYIANYRSSLTCLINEGGPLMEIKPFAMLFVMAEIVRENWMRTKQMM